MITILNRKELFTTFDMKEQGRVRNVLADNQIDYVVKTINRMSPSPVSPGTRSRLGTFGQDSDAMYEYIIYVHKSDYENARYLIRK